MYGEIMIFINYNVIKLLLVKKRSHYTKGGNMTKILNFVYVMSIILSIFIVSMNVNGLECRNDYECLNKRCTVPFEPRCIFYRCKCIQNNFDFF
ncbi:unnamed protein product [Trifolium pratense]|uniref:Uncharacterized protein n=1 Tax=Trifolium pratense TaxID=57577 RepID=A0ACB0J625_TRIPR|nr:unnamed protein product [Trifolium pratense]